MAQIIWSPESFEHLNEIAEFIAKASPENAAHTVENIIKKVIQLKNNPESGRIIPEFNKNNRREIFHGSYRIMYEINDSVIEVTAVIHGARKFNPL